MSRLLRLLLLALLPIAARAVTVIYPVEGIADLWNLPYDEYREKYAGINVTGLGPGDEGWYVRYRHENLTYLFGPLSDRETAGRTKWELEAVRDAAIRERPTLSTSRVDVVKFSYSGVYGKRGNTPYSGKGEDEDGKPMGGSGDIDGDGVPDNQDSDMDGDGIPNDQDRDMDGDGIANSQDGDMDGDGTPNGQDGDADGDGIPNDQDSQPMQNNGGDQNGGMGQSQGGADGQGGQQGGAAGGQNDGQKGGPKGQGNQLQIPGSQRGQSGGGSSGQSGQQSSNSQSGSGQSAGQQGQSGGGGGAGQPGQPGQQSQQQQKQQGSSLNIFQLIKWILGL